MVVRRGTPLEVSDVQHALELLRQQRPDLLLPSQGLREVEEAALPMDS